MALVDPDDRISRQALLELQESLPDRLVPLLVSAVLEAPHRAHLRSLAVRALGGSRHPDARASLEALCTTERGLLLGRRRRLADPSPELFAALHALARGWSDDPEVAWIFEAARTHDPLWNAAQRQLREEGIIHNYLRMLWGKLILEWSDDPRTALATMIHLNHRWALDGRDPNSTSGIMWTLGRYDRGWPERAVFGKVRSMTSASTRRKVELDRYLERFGSGGQAGLQARLPGLE